MPIPRLTPDRHLHLIKRVLHDKVGIQLVHLPHNDIDVGLMRLREEEELGPRQGLEAGQAERLAFEDLEAGLRIRGDVQGGWGEGFGDRVDAMKGPRFSLRLLTECLKWEEMYEGWRWRRARGKYRPGRGNRSRRACSGPRENRGCRLARRLC